MRGHTDDDFRETYLANYRSVVTSAWSITRDQRTAEEHAQEAFARAFPRWRRLRAGGYAVPWVHRVASNLAIDEVRRRRSRHEDPQVAGTSLDGAVVESIALGEALAGLPRRQREAVVLSVLADLPESEVARSMRVSAGSVKTHKSRGLAALRAVLADQEEMTRG